MTKQELQARIDKLESKIYNLERQIEYAFSELSELSQGIGVKPIWYAINSSWDAAMKHKASLALKILFSMRKP